MQVLNLNELLDDFKGDKVAKLAGKFTRDMAYTKAKILRRRFYRKYKAILSRILEDGVTYTLERVDKLLIEYLSKQLNKVI